MLPSRPTGDTQPAGKKPGFFRRKRSMPKLTSSTVTLKSPSTATLYVSDTSVVQEESKSNLKSVLDAALEKANVAVLYDSTGNGKEAILAYKEAVHLLETVLQGSSEDVRQKLLKVYNSYLDRIQDLSSQISHLTPSDDQHAVLQAFTDQVTTAWRLSDSKRTSIPFLMPIDTEKPKDLSQSSTPSSPASTEPSKTPRSSLFSKIANSKLAKTTPSMLDLTHPPNVPKPSKSMPVVSFTKPAKSLWRSTAASKSKPASSLKHTAANASSSTLAPLPLSLDVEIESSKDDDYFDFKSTQAASLLFQDNASPVSVVTETATSPPPPPPPLSPSPLPSLLQDKLPVSQSKDCMLPGDKEAGLVVPPPRLASLGARKHAHKISLSALQSQQSLPSTLSGTDSASETSPVPPITPPQTRVASLQKPSLTSPRNHLSTPSKPLPPLPSPRLPSSNSSYRMRSDSNQSSMESIASESSFSGPLSPTSQTSQPGQTSSSSSTHNNSSTQGRGRLSTATQWLSGPEILSPKESCTFYPYGDKRILNPDTIPPRGKDDMPVLIRLLHSLTEGGFVTNHLYMPQEAWQQPNIRLPALETKLSICGLLIGVLRTMSLRQDFKDTAQVWMELEALEHCLDQIRDNFFRKLGILDNASSPSTAPVSPVHASFSTAGTMATFGTSKTSQAIAAWGSKFSKSVERMMPETLRSFEEQNTLYFSTLVELLTYTITLDDWRMQCQGTWTSQPSSGPSLSAKIQSCKYNLERIVCAIVMQDVVLLLNKWLKRNREWMCD